MEFNDIKTPEDADLWADIEALKVLLEVAKKRAEQCGLVIRVEQVPKRPLAMGHYETVYDVRPAASRSYRKPA